jgi:hypothetical protein
MSQQRIPYFFPYISRKKAPSDTRCLFLELPASIRLKIYYEAGLVSGKTIHLNYWGIRKRDGPVISYHEWDWHLPALPYNLFAVCNSIYNELQKVLYGENRFMVSRNARRGLRALEHLSKSTLREIRFLAIHFNVSSCEDKCCGCRPYSCGNDLDNDPGPCQSISSHDTPLLSNTDQLVISQWQRICTQLAGTIQPGNLELYVVCDCADATTAQMIAKSLLLLPVLRDCGLRLAIHRTKDIKAIAKDTVLHLTCTSPPPRPPFRFFHLPKEIQRHILEYASLASRHELVSMQKQPYNCTACPSDGMIAPASTMLRTILVKCFCNGAHSAFSFHCSCDSFDFPIAMFLVSREFRECAMDAFYGQNSFFVGMEGFFWPPEPVDSESEEEPPLEMTIMPGLAQFPPTSIGRLTSLCLLFPSSDLDHLQPDQVGWGYWLTTIDILSQEANLPALTLEIRMSEMYYPGLDGVRPIVFATHPNRMRETYKTLIRPLEVLHGRLKNLFIYLNWEASYCPDERRDHEQMLERMVMGQTYDAWKCGKTTRYVDYLKFSI